MTSALFFTLYIKWKEWRTTKNIGVNEVLSFIKVKNLVLKTSNGLKFFSSGRWCAVKNGEGLSTRGSHCKDAKYLLVHRTLSFAKS